MTTLEAVEAPPLVVHMHLPMTDDQLFEFCQINSELQIEREANGDLTIMAPAATEAGEKDSELIYQLRGWAKKDGTGRAFGATAGFLLPNGAMRAPDASWVLKSRIAALKRAQREKFYPLCPDFVAELRPPSDRISKLEEKMREYMDNGARLGWLIDPSSRRVHVYRPGAAPHIVADRATISGDPELPGFTLDLAEFWD
jgi:Uma2 family endonuclease